MELQNTLLTIQAESTARIIRAEQNIEVAQKTISKLEELVQELFERLGALENSGSAPELMDETDHADGNKVRSTRVAAIAALSAELDRRGFSVSVKGHGNRGSNHLRLVDQDGAEHPIYLAASRNYFTGPDNFSAWHTPRPDDVASDRYESFILSAEDELGNILFFVLPSEEMKKVVQDRPINGGYYHFYIGRSDENSDVFVDHRGIKETDFTPYLSDWDSIMH